MPANKTSRIGHLPAVAIAMVVGFFLAYVLNFRETKKQARLQELTLLIYGNCYHIHHFIVFGILIVAMAAGRALPERALVALMAFFVGISAEDLLFKDWFLIKNSLILYCLGNT